MSSRKHLPRLSQLTALLENNAEEWYEGDEASEPLINESSVVAAAEEDAVINPDICIECEAHASQVFCEQCHDHFCDLCYEGQHRKGNRKFHTGQLINVQDLELDSNVEEGDSVQNKEDDTDDTAANNSVGTARMLCNAMGQLMRGSNSTGKALKAAHGGKTTGERCSRERAKYIPVRLTYDERKELRTLEAALATSNYTGKLDTEKFKAGGKRLRMQIQEIAGFLSGVVVATDYETGQTVLEEKNFEENAEFFRDLFELGRRYKIMNPEKMRGEYGKLMYLLQDSMLPDVQELLGFSLHTKIRTVYDVLEEADALSVLDDEDTIETATKVVAPGVGKSRADIRREIQAKENAIKKLCRDYTSTSLSRSDLEQCLYSIGDSNLHLYYERDPIDAMISYLTSTFDPEVVPEDQYKLAIVSGTDGARLSHSHSRQYHYVLQSLTLWREIAHDMFRLWYLTDEDLLNSNTNPYKLTDTGQGLHRIQESPLVSRAMHIILHTTQRNLGHWVGSSVIHLGDKNVPNGLMFIDKYTQVGHILRPIVKTLQEIEVLYQKHGGMKFYIDSAFGGVEPLKMSILADLFREAFDGSGADNFFDAGSCIDGRLTSAWNWCSELHNKSFFRYLKSPGLLDLTGNLHRILFFILPQVTLSPSTFQDR